MLGWHISVYRQTDGGMAPASMSSPKGARLAVWQAPVSGLGWLDSLVEAGNALDIGGNGYPNRYTAPARFLVPSIINGPPEARMTWVSDPSDIVGENWGKTIIDKASVAKCSPDEWLLVEFW